VTFVVLMQGRRGPDVERWQQFLIDRGLLEGRLDGVFGEKTDAATRAFQQQGKLSVDGKVGEKTLTLAQQLGFAPLRRVRDHELTNTLIQQAKAILAAHHSEPFGNQYPFVVGDRRYFGRLEQHYHPPGGPQKPWGYHTGISLFVEVAVGAGEQVLEDGPLDVA
jgi:hypothetical protein